MFPKTKKSTVIVSLYMIMAITSWFLTTGWTFALKVSDPLFKTSELHRTSGEIAISSPIVALFWPVSLPIVYCLTGYAEHGWRALWDFSPRQIDMSDSVKGILPAQPAQPCLSGDVQCKPEGRDCILIFSSKKGAVTCPIR